MKKLNGFVGNNGFIVNGYVEADEFGRPIVGRLGLRLWKKKKDILEEGFDFVRPAMLVMDLPTKIYRTK